MSRTPIDTIMLDYGGVVADHYCDPFLSHLAQLLGTSRKGARQVLSEKSPHGREFRLDQISKSQFWAEVRKLVPNQDFDEDVAQELWARTYIPNVAVLALLEHLKTKLGLQIGAVLNEDRWRHQFILENYRLHERLDIVVASFEVHCLKPERNMYLEVLKRCSRSHAPNRVIYVDDRQSHVDAALACDMGGYLYVNAGELNNYVELLDLVPFNR
jgi:FMN phosphatase YigB (HAD superfamily)